MLTMILVVLVAVTLTVPPAAKVLAISVAVYGVLQALKRMPWFNNLLKGWWSVAFNVLFSIVGVVAVSPAGDLYSMDTVIRIIQAIGTAAGIHGTVTLMKQQAENKNG